MHVHEAYDARPQASVAWSDEPRPQGRSSTAPDLPRHPDPTIAQASPAGEVQPADKARRPRRRPSVERAIPARQQLRDSLDRVSATVRKSVPLRTILFLLPPLTLPTLAFDLTPGRAVVVALLLVWLAAAAAVFSAIMLEGRDQLSLQAIERRLDAGGGSADGAPNEALLAVAGQLDALSDRIEALTRGRPAPGPVRPQAAAPDDAAAMLHHRPAEHWSVPAHSEHDDQHGPAPVPDRNWSEPRWRR